jgi:opacity protein-like surface antigen
MRKLLIFIPIVIIMFIPGISIAAEPDDYINLKVGWFWPNTSSKGLKGFEQAPVYEFDYGRNFGRNFAVEAGGTYYQTTNKDISDYKVRFYGPFATLKGKIHPIDQIELYLGAGAGYYWSEVDYGDINTKGKGIGWHALLGGGYRIIDSLALGLEGKYSQAILKSNNWNDNIDFGGISASIYLKYMF